MSSPPKAVDSPEARDTRRWTWSSKGPQTIEKNVYGRFIDDTVTAFAEVSIAGLPALWHIMYQGRAEPFGITDLTLASLVAWITMVLGVAAMRGRLLSPSKVKYEGWVPFTPSLLLFRVPYYSLAFIIAGYLGGFVGTVAGVPLLSVAIAIVIGAGAVAAFPWCTERFNEWLAQWNPQM